MELSRLASGLRRTLITAATLSLGATVLVTLNALRLLQAAALRAGTVAGARA